MKVIYRLYIIIILLSLSFIAKAQLHEEGVPLSFEDNLISDSFQAISLPVPDDAELFSEDEKFNDSYKTERFGVLVPVNVNPLNSGTWEKTGSGQQIWRLTLMLEGSLACGAYFEGFSLPDNVKLYVYDENRKQLKGAFTDFNNRQGGIFAVELIIGDKITFELNVPATVKPDNWFTISEITYVYQNLPLYSLEKGFGSSDFCEVNINCSPEGDQWQDEKRSVTRIQVKASGSTFWCTGSLVNNTRFDNTPYVLTADHCAFKWNNYATTAELESWIFYFNYEAAGCEDPPLEPEIFSVTGCEKIAHDGSAGSNGSDFYLVKLLDEIPSSFNVYFNGWSVTGEVSQEGVTIHHPDGDIKKISTYNAPLVSTGWQGSGLQSHWRVFWVETFNNWGVTEGGSSGAPLYDSNGMLIGTLTGGFASCTNPDTPDFYGKLSYGWQSNGTADTNRLQPWLDPDNTGVQILEGSTMGDHELLAPQNVKIKLYPNPVDDVLFMDVMNGTEEDLKIQVVDVFGKTILTEDYPTHKNSLSLELPELQKGLYFVRVSYDRRITTYKFVKK